MNRRISNNTRLLLAGLLGIIAGGIIVAITTRAIPKMLANIAGGVMQKFSEIMAEKMKESGMADMCQRMMMSVNEASSEKEKQTRR